MIIRKLYISESRRDDMFIDNGFNIATQQSRRDEMFNNTMNHPTYEKLYCATPKNDIAFIWVSRFTNNISSLRDCSRLTQPYFSTNISSLREYIGKSRRDDIFIEKGYYITVTKSGTDDMFITSQYHKTTSKSRRDGMFIKTIQHINHLTNSPITQLTN